jgi:hypothetical protein
LNNSGHLSKFIKSTSGSRGRGAGFGVTGCPDADEDRAEETKTGQKKDKRFPLPTLQSQASSYPLFDLEGSAICDLLFELFLKRRVLPFKDSTDTEL